MGLSFPNQTHGKSNVRSASDQLASIVLNELGRCFLFDGDEIGRFV
jgi:hypothetical protein